MFSAISGPVFVLPGGLATGILGISYQAWNNVHTWSSLALIVGVGAHLALHWKWMVSMTKRMLSPAGHQRTGKADPAPIRGEGKGDAMGRRAFLALGGAMAVAAGLFLAGRALVDAEPTEASTTGLGGNVACPRGLINDPYPGKCRHCVDTTGDGFCDYSVVG